MDFDNGKRVFNRLGPPQHQQNDNRNQKVCYNWRAGNCSRFPCPFLHHELSGPVNGTASSKRPYGFQTDDQRSSTVRRGGGSNFSSSSTWGRGDGRGNSISNNRPVVVRKDKICKYWVQGNCGFGDKCKFLHSWCTGSCFAMLTQLEGHQKVYFYIEFGFVFVLIFAL